MKKVNKTIDGLRYSISLNEQNKGILKINKTKYFVSYFNGIYFDERNNIHYMKTKIKSNQPFNHKHLNQLDALLRS